MEEMSLKYPKRVTLWPTTRRTGLKMYLLPLMPSLQWPSPVYSGWWPSLRLLASVEAPGCLQLSAVIYLSQQADVKNTLVLEMSQMGEKRNRSRVFVWLIGPISDSQKDTFFFFFWWPKPTPRLLLWGQRALPLSFVGQMDWREARSNLFLLTFCI